MTLCYYASSINIGNYWFIQLYSFHLPFINGHYPKYAHIFVLAMLIAIYSEIQVMPLFKTISFNVDRVVTRKFMQLQRRSHAVIQMTSTPSLISNCYKNKRTTVNYRFKNNQTLLMYVLTVQSKDTFLSSPLYHCLLSHCKIIILEAWKETWSVSSK